MDKTKKSPDKKNLTRNVWDYIASVAFLLAGSYYLATQRMSQGAIYIVVGLFFIFITRSRQKNKK
jgi:hypothetical protein